jgi:hypothetical protein
MKVCAETIWEEGCWHKKLPDQVIIGLRSERIRLFLSRLVTNARGSQEL